MVVVVVVLLVVVVVIVLVVVMVVVIFVIVVAVFVVVVLIMVVVVFVLPGLFGFLPSFGVWSEGRGEEDLGQSSGSLRGDGPHLEDVIGSFGQMTDHERCHVCRKHLDKGKHELKLILCYILL